MAPTCAARSLPRRCAALETLKVLDHLPQGARYVAVLDPELAADGTVTAGVCDVKVHRPPLAALSELPRHSQLVEPPLALAQQALLLPLLRLARRPLRLGERRGRGHDGR